MCEYEWKEGITSHKSLLHDKLAFWDTHWVSSVKCVVLTLHSLLSNLTLHIIMCTAKPSLAVCEATALLSILAHNTYVLCT